MAVLVFAVAGCSKPPHAKQYEIYVFGTLATITIWDGDSETEEKAISEITQHFQGLHNDWHAWQPGPLSALNKTISEGRGSETLPSIIELITTSSRLYEQSEGLFNPAIGGLLKLWGFQSDEPPNGPPPNKSVIEQWVEKRPGMEQVQVKGRMVESSNPAVQFDFGAFAKGVAIDQAIAILRRHGIENAIVNGGGDLRAIGSKSGIPWRVGVRHPQGDGVLASLNASGDESIFTSGNYERYREHQGLRYTHILDPRTGMPVNGVTSVTVIHSNGGIADAAATALVVAGPKDWARIAAKMGVHHVMLVDDSGTIYMTPEMQQRISFTKEPSGKIIIRNTRKQTK